MRDSDIRVALLELLLAKHRSDPGTLIRDEVGLCAGKRRIDVVTVNTELTGYEIKSDQDTLLRLAAQAEAYGRVLDRAILVTTKRHLDGARAMLPPWWGIIVARAEQHSIRLEDVRPPTLNNQYDAFSLAQLLWREEALEELRLRGKGLGLSKKARYYVCVSLAEAVPLNELRSIVHVRLKARPEWPGGQPQMPYGMTQVWRYE